MTEQVVKKLSDREHILLRPSMYIGGVDLTRVDDYFLENNKIEYKTIEFVPGLLKITNEILDNSIDEAIRTSFEHANKIKVSFDNKSNTITIEDNGRGIPVKKVPGEDVFQPELAWGQARAGSNFEDDESRETIGLNGVGSFATNVYSKKFIGETSDGKNKLTVTFTDNAENSKVKKVKSTKKYTKVTFEPELERFNLSPDDVFSKDSIYSKIIYQRLINLAICYPDITFYFNGKIVKAGTVKKFLSHFGESFEFINGDNYMIGIFPNETDDFKHYSYMNGLKLSQGGNHIDYVTNEVVRHVREKLSKKYKTIKPGDIRNKLFVVFFMWGYPNAKFDSQTKEKLTNSVKDIKEYLGDLDLATFSKKVLKNKDIIDPITETYRIREELKKRQDLKKLNNTKGKVKDVKYTPPIGKCEHLVLCEGESAMGGISAVLGRKNIGYIELRGKPKNVYKAKSAQILKNKEIKLLVEVLNMDLTKKEQSNISYQNIVFGTDQDLDGFHIRGLLLATFGRFGLNLIKEGRIKQLQTPLIVLKDKKDNIKYDFLTFHEYNKFISTNSTKGLYVDYKKGLGSWDQEELEQIVEKRGFDYLMDTLEYDEDTEKLIDIWFGGKGADIKKELLDSHEFDIFKV